jgi:hypothetical protein
MPQDFGNTLRTAKAIALGSAPKIWKNAIGGLDKFDFMRFDLNGGDRLVASVAGLTGRANLVLLNSKGKVIARFKQSGKVQTLDTIQSTSTYYIRVAANPNAGPKKYNLQLSVTPPPPAPPPLPSPPPSPSPPPIVPQRKDLTWTVSSPGANEVPENISQPGTNGGQSQTLPVVESGTQTFLLSQLVGPTTLSQILNSNNSSFPFVSFSLGGSRRFSNLEIDTVTGTDTNGSTITTDYKITLSINDGGQGSPTSGVIRLPGTEISEENVNLTSITRVTLDGSPLTGSDASEWLYGSDVNDFISGNGGNDYIYGGAGNDTLIGGNDDDYLNGGDGNDILDGGLGSDTMRGGSGDDYYIVRNSDDQIYEQPGGGIDTVETHVNNFSLRGDSNTIGSVTYVENLTLAEGSDALNGAGNDLNNTLMGNSANNLLYGGGGQDTLTGGTGADTFAYDSPTEGGDTITDFQPNIDTIQIYQGISSDFGSPTFNQFSYDQTTGAISFNQTVIAFLANKPSLSDPSTYITFSNSQAAF